MSQDCTIKLGWNAVCAGVSVDGIAQGGRRQANAVCIITLAIERAKTQAAVPRHVPVLSLLRAASMLIYFQKHRPRDWAAP